MKLLGTYQNGNFHVIMLDDGTKIRETEDDDFCPDFAESMDVKITNHCDVGCSMCHEGSCLQGKHGDIMNEKFIETLHPYQELALGGGDITSHPQLIPFLRKLKDLKIITNITVNQKHFEQKQELIRMLVDKNLVYGIGVSLMNPTPEFIAMVKQYPNAVIHVINGILSADDVHKLSNQGLKILILGYKHLRRGNEYFSKAQSVIEEKQAWLYDHVAQLIDAFRVVSFDNLAIEQLNIQRLMNQDEWDEFYMGDDSEFTYYIDMVERKFAKNSTAPVDQRYDLMDSVDKMFEKIRKR